MRRHQGQGQVRDDYERGGLTSQIEPEDRIMDLPSDDRRAPAHRTRCRGTQKLQRAETGEIARNKVILGEPLRCPFVMRLKRTNV